MDRIDLLINNAGILKLDSKIEDVTEETMIQSFRTNVVGPLLVTKTFLPLLRFYFFKKIFNFQLEILQMQLLLMLVHKQVVSQIIIQEDFGHIEQVKLH